jgi:hypothetical protein
LALATNYTSNHLTGYGSGKTTSMGFASVDRSSGSGAQNAGKVKVKAFTVRSGSKHGSRQLGVTREPSKEKEAGPIIIIQAPTPAREPKELRKGATSQRPPS